MGKKDLVEDLANKRDVARAHGDVSQAELGPVEAGIHVRLARVVDPRANALQNGLGCRDFLLSEVSQQKLVQRTRDPSVQSSENLLDEAAAARVRGP